MELGTVAARLTPRSLHARLLLLVFIAVIPAFVLILYTARDQRKMAEKHAQENLLRLARVVDDEYRQLIEETRQLLGLVAHLPSVRDHDAEQCSEIMRGIVKENPQYVGFAAFKPDGERFCGNMVDSGTINVADRPWFQEALRTGKFTIGSHQIGRLARRAVFPLAYPALDQKGATRAVVLAVIDLEWLKAMVAASAMPHDLSLTIADQKGLILAHHPSEEWVGKSIAGTAVEAALKSGAPGLSTITDEMGLERFVAFGRLGDAETAGAAHLILSTPQEEVFAEANRLLRRNLFWLAVVVLVIFAAAWIGSEKFVIRHVNRLLSAAQRIARGDLTARVGAPTAPGELGQLAQSFDEMAASLEQRREEVSQAHAKARENERLAAMGATVASITHELANPLNGMYTTVQLLEMQLADPLRLDSQKLRSSVEVLKNETERLRLLLQDLRFLVRPSQLTVKPVTLQDVVAEIVAVEQQHYETLGIDVELDFAVGLPPVTADREKLKQALLNLCKNAVEAMPNGGKLVLRGAAQGNEVVLEIVDTGGGIPDGVDVFELFTTTKAHGLGLGLSIVRQIIAAHGGHVSYSCAGGGTTFRITLPASTIADRAA